MFFLSLLLIACTAPGERVTIKATLLSAQIEDGAIVEKTRMKEGVEFSITKGLQNPAAKTDPATIVVTGKTPEMVNLTPGIYCVTFNYTAPKGAPYVGERTCFFVGLQPETVTTTLCADLTGDWICEDMWGAVGTPDIFYTNNDVTMHDCKVELTGISWGGQPITVVGNKLTFELGDYAADGIVDETGSLITFRVDYGIGYWSTCQKLY